MDNPEGFVNAAADGVPSLVRPWLPHVDDATIHSALTAAARTGGLYILEMLLKTGRVEDRDTAIMEAFAFGQEEAARFLLETRDVCHDDREPILHLASRKGNLNAVTFLLKTQNPDPFMRNAESKTALDVAMEAGDSCKNVQDELRTYQRTYTRHIAMILKVVMGFDDSRLASMRDLLPLIGSFLGARWLREVDATRQQITTYWS